MPMTTQSGLLSFGEARQLVEDYASRLTPTAAGRVSLLDGLGLTLAEDLRADPEPRDRLARMSAAGPRFRRVEAVGRIGAAPPGAAPLPVVVGCDGLAVASGGNCCCIAAIWSGVM